VIAVIATSLDDGGSGSSNHSSSSPARVEHDGEKRRTPESYVVQNGDTLTSIAHENGVPVARILRLNPGIDPQILISGETLKLR
jgi:LysM repeat protein